MRILIIGAGDIGYTIASRLVSEGAEVVVVESDPTRRQYCNNTLDLLVFDGNGSDPTVLKEAGIEVADMVVAVTKHDEVNITACLLAKILAPKSTRIARIRNPELSKLSALYGIEALDLALTIHPEGLAAKKVVDLLKHDGAVDYISFADGMLNVLGLPVPKESPIVGEKLMDLGQKHDWWHKILLAAVQRGSEVLIPRGNLVINAKDVLYTVTTPTSKSEVMSLLNCPGQDPKNIMMYGSDHVARAILDHLEKEGLRVKIIEPSLERCEIIAGQVAPSTIVLHGEGTDEKLLKSENIRDMDAFIACAEEEETNILAAVLAKRLGAKSVIAVTNKPIFTPILAANGINITVSPSYTAIGSILQFIRLGRVLSVQPFFDDSAEFIEFIVPEEAPIVGQALKNFKLPHEAILTSIVRGSAVVIPRGETIIEAGDRVLVFTKRRSVHKVEQVFTAEIH